MAKANQTLLENRLGSIDRGAYWFGIIGRLSIIAGFAMLVFAGVVLYLEGMRQVGGLSTPGGPLSVVHSKEHMDGIGNGLIALLEGWMFLRGRDAFEAISALIKEMQEIA